MAVGEVESSDFGARNALVDQESGHLHLLAVGGDDWGSGVLVSGANLALVGADEHFAFAKFDHENWRSGLGSDLNLANAEFAAYEFLVLQGIVALKESVVGESLISEVKTEQRDGLGQPRFVGLCDCGASSNYACEGTKRGVVGGRCMGIDGRWQEEHLIETPCEHFARFGRRDASKGGRDLIEGNVHITVVGERH